MSVRDTNSKDHICEGSNGNKDSPKSWTADIYAFAKHLYVLCSC